MRSGTRALLALAGAAVVLAALVLLSRGPERQPPPAAGVGAPPDVASARPGAPPASQGPDATDPAPSAPEDLRLAELSIPPGFDPDDPAVGWAQVDMDAVRRALPDNRFWTAHMPTKDAAVLAEREREQERERALRTKVESGNASREEVDAHFTHLHKVFTDGIEFTTYLIEHYGEDLSERDVGLLMLARKLHRARLVELPREHARAHELRERMEKARSEWQAMQAAFAEDDGPDGDPDSGSTPP
jgi:hypothetical protein